MGPTIPSTIEIECDTNPYMRCNDPLMLQRLGCDVEANQGQDDTSAEEQVEREAGALKKLLELRKHTYQHSVLPMGLPRSYSEGVNEAKVKIGFLVRAMDKVKATSVLSRLLLLWMANVGISPRPSTREAADDPPGSPERKMFTPDEYRRSRDEASEGEVMIEMDENPVAGGNVSSEDERTPARLHMQ